MIERLLFRLASAMLQVLMVLFVLSLGLLMFALAANAQTLPNNWYGAFASYDSAAHPSVAAGAAFATLVSASTQTYSYSSWDLTLIKQPRGSVQAYTYQSTPETGVAILLPNLGPVPLGSLAKHGIYVLGLFNMGVATTGQNASLATSAGGVGLWKIPKTNLSLFGGLRMLNTGALGGSKLVPGFGIGLF